jgi:23S rRNA (uracil1939-C5)-methyltransferase
MKRPRPLPAQSRRPAAIAAQPPRQPAQSQLVTLEKPIYGGASLAHIDGKAVFVPLTLPGEQARIRIVEDKRGYATAEADEIVTASPERVAPGCPHFRVCGGCQYQHANYAAQLAMKQAVLRETLVRAGVEPHKEIAVLAGESEAQAWRYRNRIRLAFDAAGNPGYRGRRSHAVVPISQCPIAAPLLVEAAFAAAEVAREFAPALRPSEIALFCNHNETVLLASAFTTSAGKIHFDEFCSALHDRIPALQGAELIVESRPERNSPAPPRTIAQWGATSLTYRAAGFDYRVDHGAFFQVNRWLVDALAEQVTAGHTGAMAWDLFAGVGLFARRLTASFARVVAVESAPPAIDALKANLLGTTGTASRATTLDSLRSARAGQRPDLIVVDPPRTGLGAEITGLLAHVAAPRVVYVSCDPATMARDLRALLSAGYAIHSLTLADLFPQTFHIEAVVQLRRP